ncbi:hypothetical protein PTTG_03375 [Puccinia triticina 1-1 BBBD Race 1]|uniref:FHA domain-containing protein n=1 Tax=Puccinia triticina (isolate 1-1 / race 1 (BBBD)) TaxID=630390 RepID=A0A180GNW3_PUCT1|nr:hypothetical protein PTTG_03375 [Puccinia triticina 1-1 BBBD Race 1]
MGEQPAERPADGQLHGNALGYLLVLSQPSARLALNCPETTIGSSPHLATICLEDPARIQAIHLIIHIDNNHRASLQVVGPSGITLNNSHLQPSPEPVPLNDRDTFSIDQFPFRWEQRWDNHLTDWSRFTSPSKQPQQQQEEEPQTLLLDITPEKHPSPPKLLISPTKNNQQFTFQWDQESNVSFRRRPRNSIDTHRSRAHSPTDADQSSEDEEEEEEEESDELPTTDPSSLPLTGISLQESPQDPPPPSSPQEASPSQPPRLKSLLQNLLIKQAVQVHLAHHPPSTLPDDETPSSSSAATSGFSSSEDEQEDDDPESTDTDDEILQRPAEPADVSMASSPPASPNPTIAPSDAICPSNPVSLPSTLVRPTFDRRSLSPNAQLLSEFQQTGSPTRTSPPKTLVFPLKSSFRRQSYSAHELAAFSSPPPSSSSTSPYPTTPSPSSPSSSSSRAVRLNTQINSRSPSFPVDPHPPSNAEALRNRLRSSARAPASALPSPPPPPPLPPPPVPEPTHLTPAAIPHRIIRTPRSFLIKRRGSLTPLTAPVCDNTLLLLPSQNEEDYQHATLADDNKKRKVRFDRDVFCLEFDQLPEELPLSRQPKRAKVLPEDDQPDPATTKRKGQRRNTVSVDRPRRQSPRLVVLLTAPIEEEELSDLEAPSAPGEETQACAAAAPVDLSGLSLSNPPSPSPADAAHLPSGTAVDPCTIIPASPPSS